MSLIGPSGCGKSTLMRLIADLDEATTGSIEVFGKTAAKARVDQEYGIAFQQAGLLPWRTVAGNIALPLELHGSDRAARTARVAELAELVGLTEFVDRYPDQLSGGMQQRVAIARAFAEHPRLLLMDEPFGALDEMTREYLQTELARIAAETGAAVVFVTHSIPEAVFLSDRVVVMSPRPGRITEIIPTGFGDARGEALRESKDYFAQGHRRARGAARHAGREGERAMTLDTRRRATPPGCGSPRRSPSGCSSSRSGCSSSTCCTPRRGRCRARSPSAAS